MATQLDREGNSRGGVSPLPPTKSAIQPGMGTQGLNERNIRLTNEITQQKANRAKMVASYKQPTSFSAGRQGQIEQATARRLMAEKQNIVPLPPAGNAQVLNGQQIAPPVNLAQTATQQPGYVSPEQIGGMRRASEIMVGKNTINGPVPQGVDGGPQLPGQGMQGQTVDNDYMQRNYGEQVSMPRTPEQRMAEGQESLARINRGTEAMIANRPGGNGPTTAVFNPKAAELPDFSTGDADFDKRHGQSQRAGETARMKAQTDAARLGNTANIAAGNQAVDREGIASRAKIANDRGNAAAEQNQYDNNTTAEQNQYERQKYQQGRVDRSKEFDAKQVNVMGQHMNDPDFNTFLNKIKNAPPELKAGYEDAWLKKFNFPSSMYESLMAKNTQKAGYDDMSVPILPPGQ